LECGIIQRSQSEQLAGWPITELDKYRKNEISPPSKLAPTQLLPQRYISRSMTLTTDIVIRTKFKKPWSLTTKGRTIFILGYVIKISVLSPEDSAIRPSVPDFGQEFGQSPLM
jgi:hypothetical protein